MTPQHLQQIKERAEKLNKTVLAIPSGGAFEMSIPPQPEDTDVLCKQVNLVDIPALLTEVEHLQSQLATALQDISRLTAENAKLEKIAKIVSYDEETYQAYQKALKNKS